MSINADELIDLLIAPWKTLHCKAIHVTDSSISKCSAADLNIGSTFTPTTAIYIPKTVEFLSTQTQFEIYHPHDECPHTNTSSSSHTTPTAMTLHFPTFYLKSITLYRNQLNKLQSEFIGYLLVFTDTTQVWVSRLILSDSPQFRQILQSDLKAKELKNNPHRSSPAFFQANNNAIQNGCLSLDKQYKFLAMGSGITESSFVLQKNTKLIPETPEKWATSAFPAQLLPIFNYESYLLYCKSAMTPNPIELEAFGAQWTVGILPKQPSFKAYYNDNHKALLALSDTNSPNTTFSDHGDNDHGDDKTVYVEPQKASFKSQQNPLLFQCTFSPPSNTPRTWTFIAIPMNNDQLAFELPVASQQHNRKINLSSQNSSQMSDISTLLSLYASFHARLLVLSSSFSQCVNNWQKKVQNNGENQNLSLNESSAIPLVPFHFDSTSLLNILFRQLHQHNTTQYLHSMMKCMNILQVQKQQSEHQTNNTTIANTTIDMYAQHNQTGMGAFNLNTSTAIALSDPLLIKMMSIHPAPTIQQVIDPFSTILVEHLHFFYPFIRTHYPFVLVFYGSQYDAQNVIFQQQAKVLEQQEKQFQTKSQLIPTVLTSAKIEVKDSSEEGYAFKRKRPYPLSNQEGYSADDAESLDDPFGNSEHATSKMANISLSKVGNRFFVDDSDNIIPPTPARKARPDGESDDYVQLDPPKQPQSRMLPKSSVLTRRNNSSDEEENLTRRKASKGLMMSRKR